MMLCIQTLLIKWEAIIGAIRVFETYPLFGKYNREKNIHKTTEISHTMNNENMSGMVKTKIVVNTCKISAPPPHQNCTTWNCKRKLLWLLILYFLLFDRKTLARSKKNWCSQVKYSMINQSFVQGDFFKLNFPNIWFDFSIRFIFLRFSFLLFVFIYSYRMIYQNLIFSR